MKNPNGTLKPTTRTVRQLINDGLPQEWSEFLGAKTKKAIRDMERVKE